jgi:hypothetical protein
MMFQNATRVIMALAVTTALAQGTPPATAGSPQADVPGGNDVMQRQGYAGRRAPLAKQPHGVPVQTSLRERVHDMESTLNQMRLVLTKMHDKAAKSKTQDSLAKANLDMWELMVRHLDKELRELKIAMAAREDMEARRAALYKQADAKADAEAQAARAAEAARFGAQAPTPVSGAEGAVQSPAGQTEATQAPAAQTPSPAAAPASPATSTPSPN